MNALSQTELNKLRAKALKARLAGKSDAEELEAEYEKQLAIFEAVSESPVRIA